MKKRLRYILSILLSTLFLILGACAPLPAGSTTPENGLLAVHFLDVGQGDATLLMCNGESMLIDRGDGQASRLIVAYLRQQHITKLDYVVCTHPHEDHVGGLSGALHAVEAGSVLSSTQTDNSTAFQSFAAYAAAQSKTITIPAPGDEFSLGNAQVKVLGPLQDYEDENNNSLVLQVSHGANSFLFTGDAEELSEKDLLNTGVNLESTVLKVGHHGSNSSTTYRFLREVMPAFAVISVGKENAYGHPHQAPLSRLRDAGVTLYRTDMQGHILAVSDGEAVSFTTQRTALAPTNPTEYADTVQYIGNLRSHKVHRFSCPALPAGHHQVFFSSLEDAFAKGYSTCSTCQP